MMRGGGLRRREATKVGRRDSREPVGWSVGRAQVKQNGEKEGAMASHP
jgi:hypothetical protein